MYKQKTVSFFLLLTILGWLQCGWTQNQNYISVLAPLSVGNPLIPLNSSEDSAWGQFAEELQIAKVAGVEAISTDIWWGLVEREQPGKYDWAFYDRMVALIKKAGLRWNPILSFHQLGGNVGDVGYIPLPTYIWGRFEKDRDNFPDQEAMKFKSEQGNVSTEYVSFWATDLIRDDLRRFMEAFREHFMDSAGIIDEINISMGPSGELRYPSYNQHDSGVEYPRRGALQAYSLPAVRGFRKAMQKKYGTIEGLSKAWGFNLQSFEQVFPPSREVLRSRFWQSKEHFSPYGRDFFDYYNDVLVRHGQTMFEIADGVFGEEGSPFRSKELGGKIPGIHWRLGSDRLAELSAGLIRTSYDDWRSPQAGYGYTETLKAFSPHEGTMRRILTFTAIEMSDHRDNNMGAASMGKTLMEWVAEAARAQHIPIAGENALGWELRNPGAWQNISEALLRDGIERVTLLRLDEIARDPVRLDNLTHFHSMNHQRPSVCQRALQKVYSRSEF